MLFLVRVECVRFTWLLAETKVATILGIFFFFFLPPLKLVMSWKYLEKECRDKVDEVKLSKDVIKGLTEEICQNNEEIKLMKKNLKQKEKESYNLQAKVGNLEEINRRIKEEINEKSRELKKLKKKFKKEDTKLKPSSETPKKNIVSSLSTLWLQILPAIHLPSTPQPAPLFCHWVPYPTLPACPWTA
jgi:hypothetical protein